MEDETLGEPGANSGDEVENLMPQALSKLEQKHPRYGKVMRDLLNNEGRMSDGLRAELALTDAQLRLACFRARTRFRDIVRELRDEGPAES